MFDPTQSNDHRSSGFVQMIRRCFTWYPWQMTLAMTWIVVLQIIALLPVLLIGQITDVMAQDEPSLTLLISYLVAFLGTAVVVFVLSPACSKYLWRLCETTISRLAQSWVMQILYQDIRLFQQGAAGDLVSATKRGIHAYRQILQMALSVAVPMLLKVFIIISLLVYFGSLAMLPMILLCSVGACGVQWQLIAWRRKYIHQLNQLEDEWYDSLVELFMGAKSIKIARAETTATSRLRANYVQYQHQASDIAWVSGILQGTQSAAFYLTVVGVLALGLLSADQDLAMAEWVTIFLLTLQLIETVGSFLNSIQLYDEHRLDALELTRLLQYPSSSCRDSLTPRQVVLKHYDLHFKPFSLSLAAVSTDNQRSTFSLVNPAAFVMPFGSHVAIIGASGEGKTMLLEALFGFRPLPEKAIFLGEHDIVSLTVEQRRQGIYFSPYQPAFLSGQWRRSVLLNHPDWPHDNFNNWIQQLELAALLGATELPGWDAERLSDGEKKRLAILRCLRWNAQIVLADEPTASLDQELKSKAWDTLLHGCQDKTLICVTHDLCQLHRFDGVIKIKDHRITLVKSPIISK